MQIEKIKINNYGNLKNKEIQFGENINIIYGSNESGKSTMLNFIKNMLYGISKNKKGEKISEYEKYMPWVGDEFSGKIEYKLNNGETLEVFRDFRKNKIQIINKFGEDIAENFEVDKLKNNLFFYEQTNVNESLFTNSFMTKQKKVEIGALEQSEIIQKISNMIETGDELVSYNKALENIGKRKNDEIGSLKTRGKPINKIEDEIEEYEKELRELKKIKLEKENLVNSKASTKEEVISLENKKMMVEEYKTMLIEQDKQQEKIILHENMLEKNNFKIKELNNQIKEINNKKDLINNEKKKVDTIEINNNEKNRLKKTVEIFILIFALSLILGLLFQNIYLVILSLLVIIVVGIIKINMHLKNTVNKNSVEVADEKLDYSVYTNQIAGIKSKIEVLDLNNTEITNLINQWDYNFDNYLESRLHEWKEKYKEDISIKVVEDIMESCDYENVDIKISVIQNKINDSKVRFSKIRSELLIYEEVCGKINSINQAIVRCQIEEEELRRLGKSMEYAKELLELAYAEMKNKMTPGFVEGLSRNMENISCGKYRDIRLSDKEGISVVVDTGEIVPASRLSGGTIDQLYLSMRLAWINEFEKESIPIFLDETFVYYDNKRLSQILKYLVESDEKRQIFIFTCNNREIELLDKKFVEYKKVMI